MSETRPFPKEAVGQEAENIITAFRERVPALRAAGLDDIDMLLVLMEGASRVAAMTLARIALFDPGKGALEQEAFVDEMMKVQVYQAQAALQFAREQPEAMGGIH